MKIAIDARTICDAGGGPGAGIEHYTWSTIFALIRRFPKERFSIFIPAEFPVERRLELIGSCRNSKLVVLPTIPVIGRQVIFPLTLYAMGMDVLFVPTPHIPLLWKKPAVVTVHDVSIFTHPEWFPVSDVNSVSTTKLVPRSLKQAKRLVAVSAFTARQLEEQFPETSGRVSVAYPGVTIPSHVTASNRLDVPAEFLLCLGTVEPRKNLAQAIFSFHKFLSDHPDRPERTRLVLAGKWGWKTEDVQAAMDEVNAAWHHEAPDGVIRSLGPVTEDEKWELLSRASALFFPSLEEGFGLPALEAMALGVPVICSDRGALPEIVGDVAFICPPDDEEAMSLMLAQLLLMPEAASPLVEDGQTRAADFTWEKTADGIMLAIEEAAISD